MHNCHVDANCSNTRGSFYCTCHTGYSGDGVTCIGKFTRIDTITLPIDNMADSVFPLPLPLLPCLSFLLGRRLWSLDRLSFNVFQVLRFTLLTLKKKNIDWLKGGGKKRNRSFLKNVSSHYRHTGVCYSNRYLPQWCKLLQHQRVILLHVSFGIFRRWYHL